MMTVKHSFEKLPRESLKAFAAFSIYLNLGPERSVRAVGKKLGKSEGLLERWSARFDWSARAAAFDSHMANIEYEAAETAAIANGVDWAKRQEALREQSWSSYERCIAAAEKALARFMDREADATLGEIARMLEVATKLGCLATGLAADRVAVVGDEGGPIRVEHMAALERAYGDKPALNAPGGGNGQVVEVEIDGAAGAAGGALLADGAKAPRCALGDSGASWGIVDRSCARGA